MSWFSAKVSLGNFPDLAGAVNKLSESVKNIEKNFDSALGLEEKSDATSSGNEASGALWPSPTDRKALFEPIMGFMGQKGDESTAASLEQPDALEPTSPLKGKEIEDDGSPNDSSKVANEETKKVGVDAEPVEEIEYNTEEQKDNTEAGRDDEEGVSPTAFVEASEQNPEHIQTEFSKHLQEKERSEESSTSFLESEQTTATSPIEQVDHTASVPKREDNAQFPERVDEQKAQKDIVEVFSAQAQDLPPEGLIGSRESSSSDSPVKTGDAGDDCGDNLAILQHSNAKALDSVFEAITKPIELKQNSTNDTIVKERLSTGSNSSDATNTVAELEKVKKEMKMMETALQGAARQAQAKADEIAKLMNENEQLKASVDDFRGPLSDKEGHLHFMTNPVRWLFSTNHKDKGTL